MEELALQAGLSYVNDSEPGYYRKPWGRGFTYLDRKDQHITNKKVRQVQKCQELPGQQLFQYLTEDGAVVDLTSTDVNEYLHEYTGQQFSAKDFRTWGATVAATEKLVELGPAESADEAEKNMIDYGR